MRLYWVISVIVISSCHQGVEEKLVVDQLNQNSVSLEKQLNLMEKNSVLLQAEVDPSNPLNKLLSLRKALIEKMKKGLRESNSIEDARKVINSAVTEFNTALSANSALKLEWESQFLESNKYDLLESWKENNRLLVELAMLEKCLEFFEIRSQFAAQSVKPVIYSRQYRNIREGYSPIFEVAFQSAKPELVELEITKSTRDGKPMDKKEIELDHHTQRFIVHNLKKGKYEVEGTLSMTNNRGIKESYPFSEKFTVD